MWGGWVGEEVALEGVAEGGVVLCACVNVELWLRQLPSPICFFFHVMKEGKGSEEVATLSCERTTRRPSRSALYFDPRAQRTTRLFFLVRCSSRRDLLCAARTPSAVPKVAAKPAMKVSTMGWDNGKEAGFGCDPLADSKS